MPKKPAQTAKSNADPLEQFVENLIAEKHRRSLPPVTHRKIKYGLMDELHETLHKKLLLRLHHEQKAEVEKLLHKGTPHKEVQRFLLENVPDSMVYLTHVLLHFRFSYLAR